MSKTTSCSRSPTAFAWGRDIIYRAHYKQARTLKEDIEAGAFYKRLLDDGHEVADALRAVFEKHDLSSPVTLRVFLGMTDDERESFFNSRQKYKASVWDIIH
jgi:hypothetical protein